MSYDWNQNGRQDSFDRYMDYNAAHPERNSSNSQSNYNGDYSYNDTSSMDGREKIPYYKNHPYEEEKEDKPPYLLVFIISILVGVLSGVIAALVNR